MAFRLIYDYTVSFSLSVRNSAAEQRVRDAVTRRELHAFLRSLPVSRFPVLTRLGDQVWADDRFAASLAALPRRPASPPASTPAITMKGSPQVYDDRRPQAAPAAIRCDATAEAAAHAQCPSPRLLCQANGA